MTAAIERLGDWNWTSTRKVALSLVEKKPLGVDGQVLIFSRLALIHVCSFLLHRYLLTSR